jgi:hypothetical protein
VKKNAVFEVYDNSYKYRVCGADNNGELIRRVLDSREWWKDIKD